MAKKGDKEEFKSWLCESVLALCRGGLRYRENFSIEGVLGITVDHNEVFLVRIHDQNPANVTRSEKAVQVCLEDHQKYLCEVEEIGLSESDSDTPRPDSDHHAEHQSTVVTSPLVTTLHSTPRPSTASRQTNHKQLSRDGGDPTWHTREALLLGSEDANCETKSETAAQIESDLELSTPDRNFVAANLIPPMEITNVDQLSSHGQSSVYDQVDVDMNSSEPILTKIKQELNVESWDEQSGCDGYEPADTFGNYASQQGATWDCGGPHSQLRDMNLQQQPQNHCVKTAPWSRNAVSDVMSLSLDTISSNPMHNLTMCQLCKQGTRNLKKHMKVCQMSSGMLGEGKYPCNKCSRLFKTRSYLIDHERSFHSNVPAYECCHCHRLFRYRMQLKRHKVNCSALVASDPLPPSCIPPSIT